MTVRLVGALRGEPPVLLAGLACLLCACASSEAQNSELGATTIDDVWHEAKLRGVSFRAVGGEPGWLLEISDGTEIVLVTDFGAKRQSYPYVEPVVEQAAARTRYVVDDGELVIVLEGGACNETMSDEVFEVSVTVSTEETVLHGCGRALY